MTVEESSARTPMYASYATFTTFLDWLKDMKAIPTQIDRSVWSEKFSGSGGAQLIGGLGFLRLLDGNQPTETLEELVVADAENRKRILRDVLRGVYGDQLVDGLPRMTPRMLDDSLRALGTTDSTHKKAVSFFINAAKAVGIDVPANIAKRARNRPSAPRKRVAGKVQPPPNNADANKGQAKKQDEHTSPPPVPMPEGDAETVELKNGAGQVTIILNIRNIRLLPADREFVFGLVDSIARYKAGEPEADATASSDGINAATADVHHAERAF